MSDARAELTSIATQLDEMIQRIVNLGLAQSDEGLRIELFEVERTLNNADRRLQKLL